MTEAQTLNTVDSSNTDDQGTLNDEGTTSIPVELSEDMVSTVEYTPAPVKDQQNPDQSKADEDKAKADEEAKAKAEAEKNTPFHDHPRFKELVAEKNEYKARLDAIEKQVAERTQPNQRREASVLQQLANMKDDELRDMFDENPKALLSNVIRAAVDESQSKFEQHLKMTDEEKRTQSYQEGVKKTFETFGSEHADFWPMWDSGDIKKYMEANPGHNAISAYNVLTAEKSVEARQQDIEKAVKEAVAKKEQEMLANFKAKRNAQTLSAGPSRGPSEGVAPELRDTKAHGGITATLAERLKAMRSA